MWQAIADAEKFGAWFGVRLDGAFAAGSLVRGTITRPGYEHITMELLIDRVVPEHLFSYRWHPYAIAPDVDYSAEPTTLVEFTLDETAGGTVLTIVESGFDGVPLARRAEAFRMNSGGWAEQIKNIERYVSQP